MSTDQQADSGLSLEAQESKIRAMAQVKGAELVEVIVDAAESAKDLHRPGVQRLMELVKAGKIQGVIIAKLDRLTRSVRDACALVDLFNRKDVALISLAESLDTGSAVGRMLVNVLAAFAQMEREVGAERTSAALQQKKKRGERAGTIPYGFKLGEDGKLAPEESEQKVIATAKELREDGVSFRDIAQELNFLGMKTRRGTEFRFQYVANIVGKK